MACLSRAATTFCNDAGLLQRDGSGSLLASPYSWRLENVGIEVHLNDPLCGDEVTVYADLRDGKDALLESGRSPSEEENS